jgi:hypothetical protein
MKRQLLVLAAALGSIGLLKADVVTYTVTPVSGQFRYDLTLTNTGDTGGTLFDLFLSLPTDIGNIDTATIGTPVGWGDPPGGLLFFGPDAVPSTSFIEWASDFSGTFDVGIGNSLSGFSFNSSVSIGQPITFALNGSTNFATAREVTETTPEPATLGFVIGAALLAGIWRRKPVLSR